MLLVQQYLKNNSFADLVREHGVYASFSKSGHKFSLNYDQIEAKESDPLAQECRGLILALADGSVISEIDMPDGKTNRDNVVPGKTQILAYPMKRFFNYGQGSAANINWQDPNIAVLEKLDGTLCIIYFDPIINQWCVATRSVPEADIIMDNDIYTFRTLFEKAVLETTKGMTFQQLTNAYLDKNITYCFELTTPYNRIVVHYPNSSITLLAARKLSNLQEIDMNKLSTIMNGSYIPFVRTYAYTSVDDMVNWISTLNPIEHEGVVIRDSDFNRIKIKNALYIAYNKARDVLGTSERNCLEIILAEKDDDVIPFLPEEIVKNLLKIKNNLQILIKRYDDSYSMFKMAVDAINPGDKKTFALMINESAKINKYWTAPFFQIFAGKATSMKDFIQQSRKDGTWANSFLDKLLEISKNYEE